MTMDGTGCAHQLGQLDHKQPQKVCELLQSEGAWGNTKRSGMFEDFGGE